jgi:beta-lactam-binding protein with PASTA domain
MPHIVGLTRARAFAVMRKDSLYFDTAGPGSAKGTWTTVAAQSPAPGTPVAWHATVHLTTSLQPYHGSRAVPSLAGLTRTQVFSAMKRAQLYFDTKGPGSASGKWVVAVRQSPAAGTRVRWHSVVEVTTSLTRPKPRPKPRPKVVVREIVKAKPVVKAKPEPKSTATTTTTTTIATPPSTTYPGETTTTTTTTVPVTTTTVKKLATRYRVGVATWYRYVPGRCATWYLPMGTHVVVRDMVTGKSINCVVTDREGAHGDRAVDLNQTQFAELAPLTQGVINVKVSW